MLNREDMAVEVCDPLFGFRCQVEIPQAVEFSAWTQFLYFSLTTLTTLGYGDITPINPFARIWATLEAVVGTLYVAILVARLVSLYRR